MREALQKLVYQIKIKNVGPLKGLIIFGLCCINIIVGHPVDGKLRPEIALQIDKLDDQQRKHWHRNGAPKKDRKVIA
uniref:Uncharacterized protein n=1 Tax=Romanomermis culicivorax TaxID=13658 RepID=A0A915KLH5_ROMCU